MSTALSWLIVWVRALMAEDLASLNIRSISTGPSPAFALPLARPLQDCSGGGLGIKAVGLAPPAAGGLVGLVDFDDLDATLCGAKT
jgi:hypothetical protein